MKIVLDENQIASAIAFYAERKGYEVDYSSKVRIQVDADNHWTATETKKETRLNRVSPG